MALKGLGDRIHDVGIIQCETEHFEIYKDQPLFRDIKRYLSQRGFLLTGFTSFEHYSADAVFVNKSIASSLQKPVLKFKTKALYKFKRATLPR